MDTAPALKTALTRSGSRTTVTVAGEIDIDTVAELRQALATALSDGARLIDVDFTDVAFCDCTGLAVLLRAGRYARARGASLRVVNVTSSLVQRLFVTTRTADVLSGPPSARPLTPS
ncbi:STAS domain-containing protein [Streptomyces sp. NPDC053755]|uniref:STAS domain-containing protein n=1 Tax=Streptomyces sp. NPDC053755 TaxID=3155815 RepID=UPI00344A036C